MQTFLVLAPGPYTTVQDLGRWGHQQMGVPVSGALDAFSARVANLLVDNPEECAVLETTVVGPQLAVLRETDIALTGAEMEMRVNYRPVAGWRSVRVRPGDMVSIGQVKSGCRGYLAVGGGIAVPEVMGSRSTYAGGGMGGYRGRSLQKGDIVDSGDGALLGARRELPAGRVPRHSEPVVLRAVAGPQDDYFDAGLDTLFGSEFTVSATADRMGYRLQGPPIPHRPDVPKSIISEPTIPGGVQIPADLQPIILLVEQTVGGYAKAATVISTDLSRVAQAIPGDRVRFERVDLDTAHRIYRERETLIGAIAEELAAGAKG